MTQDAGQVHLKRFLVPESYIFVIRSDSLPNLPEIFQEFSPEIHEEAPKKGHGLLEFLKISETPREQYLCDKMSVLEGSRGRWGNRTKMLFVRSFIQNRKA